MLTIRLQRTGSKNKPQFRIVLAEAHRAASKKFLEILGNYSPGTKQFGIKDEARLKYWVSQNVQVSPTVHNLFVSKNLMTEKKVKAWRPKVKAKEEGAATAAPAAPAAAATTESAPAA